MSTDKRYATLILESLLDQKHNSNPTPELQSKLQEKLTFLETNYSKMEADYFKKIKELKGILTQRNRKHANLNSQIASLREEFKNHQQEILKITQQLAAEKGRSNEPKQQKKNSSPGLLKKSLENEKKIDKRMSPTAHNQLNSNAKTDKSQPNISENQASKNEPPKKGYSPTNNTKKLVQLFSNENNKQSAQTIKNDEPKKVTKPSNQDRSPENQTKKQNYSPKQNSKNSQLKGFLINSLKNFEKQKPSGLANASPKRIIKRSPGTQPRVEKKLLGNLKEEIMEAF